MARTTLWICLAAAFPGIVFAQLNQPGPKFQMADVHVASKSPNAVMRAGFYRGGRYELHNATMVDLVRTAYGFDADKVVGGPSWLSQDLFEVVAIAPPDATPDSLKLMLQALLAERFSLVVHKDTKPLAAYGITVGDKPLLKPSDGKGEAACKVQSNDTSTTPAQNVVRTSINGLAVQLNLALPIPFACRNMSIKAFADGLRTMVGAQAFIFNTPVVDLTELKGTWDFDIKWSLRQNIPQPASGPATIVTIFDAFEKQLGLKLELTKTPFPVIAVDSVNEIPTANLPGVSEKLAPPPLTFEVADVKPSMPFPNSGVNAGGGGGGGLFMQGPGRINLQGQSLKRLIATAWNLPGPDMVAGGPKSADTVLYDIAALAPVPEVAPGFANGMGGQFDMESMRMMLRTLLKERFKLEVHEEERPVPVYELVAINSTVRKADPANRPGCAEGPAPGEKDPRTANPAATRLVTCLNMSMAEFLVELRNRASGYLAQLAPPVDATGLQGKYDLTVNFSPAGMGGPAGAPPGTITLFDALEKQLGLKLQMGKHPGTALVIDHCEEKPIDN